MDVADPLYDPDAIKAFLVDLFDDAPRGRRAEIVRLTGVKASTLTKWSSGQTCPSPEYWDAIERAFGLDMGKIKLIGTRYGVGSPVERPVRRLDPPHASIEEQVRVMEAEEKALRKKVAEAYLIISERVAERDHALAANEGEPELPENETTTRRGPTDPELE